MYSSNYLKSRIAQLFVCILSNLARRMEGGGQFQFQSMVVDIILCRCGEQQAYSNYFSGAHCSNYSKYRSLCSASTPCHWQHSDSNIASTFNLLVFTKHQRCQKLQWSLLWQFVFTKENNFGAIWLLLY